MTPHDSLPLRRPADVCRALLTALEGAEGRRRSRKRDQTPDAFGLSVKRVLLQQVVAEDPGPDEFEAWLIDYPQTCGAPELAGPARAMARAVFEDWRLAHISSDFRRWLEEGAPSADAQPGGAARPHQTDAARSASREGGTSAVILAGGRSSRMGSAKALLRFDDRPLVAHLVDALASRFSEVVVVAAPGQELPPLPALVVRDDVSYQGPVGGLCYGLAAVTGESAFVTSCDAVFLDFALIDHLVTQLRGYDVVVPRWEDRAQPLHAVYRRSVLPLLRDQLERGELRPVSLFDKVRTRWIDADEIRRFDPEGWSFFNMNTPDDYARALERWREHGADRAPGDASPEAPSVVCGVELFGAARLAGGVAEVEVSLSPGAQFSDLLRVLGERLPGLRGVVLSRDGTRLNDGYACSVNGLEFVRALDTPVRSGERYLILSADAGG